MRLISRIATLLILLSTIAAAALPAYAGGYLYAGKRRHINCGVLYIPGATQPLGAGGVADLFYLLDQRSDLKPSGWSFENPLSAFSSSTAAGKSLPDYWVVDISTVNNLSKMHVLYLPAEGHVVLNRQDSEKLRKFVDGGGILWIDNASATHPMDFIASGTMPENDPGTLFIHGLYFEQGAASTFQYPADRHHPLLSSPYWLNPAEVAGLGAIPGAAQCIPGYKTAMGTRPVPPICFDGLLSIVDNTPVSGPGVGGVFPSVAANVYGSGRIVATADFIGRGCYPNTGNGYSALPNLKFAYNVISWAASSTTLRKDNRHSGSSIDTLGGVKLIGSWTLPSAPPSPTAENSPVIYKNVVFYTSGTKLYAMDAYPNEDLDQDGNSDDGEQDMKTNTGGQDIIWEWSAPDGGDLSSPTVVSMPNPTANQATIEAVLVQSSAGITYMLDAFPHDLPTGKLYPDPGAIIDQFSTAPFSGGESKLCPPISANGWVYACGGDGRLYAHNPALAAWNAAKGKTNPVPCDWNSPTASSGLTGSASGSASLRAGPSYCFTQDSKTGAIIGVVYWYISKWDFNSGGVAPNTAPENDSVKGVPVFVGSERVKIVGTNATRTLVQCRINYSDGKMAPIGDPSDQNARKQIVQIEGFSSSNITDVTPNASLVGGNINGGDTLGSFVIQSTVPIPANAVIYATYAINDASDQLTQIYVAPRINQQLEPILSADTGTGMPPAAKIAGTPAIGPDNMLYINATRGTDTPATIYGIKSDGSSNTTRWLYHLHSGQPDGVTNAAGHKQAPIPAVVTYKNPGASPGDPGFLQSMNKPQPSSSPVIADGKVFVTVSGQASGYGEPSGPRGALLCFKANPDFTIRIMENGGLDASGNVIKKPKRLIDPTGRKMRVKLWQPNVLLPNCESNQPQDVIGDWVDYEQGIITIQDFGRLKLPSISSTGASSFRASLSPSLPVWVFLDESEVPIDWTTWGPMEWARKQFGVDLNTWADTLGVSQLPPTATSVDLSGWNNLMWYYVVPGSEIHSSPTVIGNTVYFTSDDGVLYALNTETGESRGGAVTDCLWQKELTKTSLSATTGGIPASPSASGANGVLLVPAGDGLHALANATTLVADSNRLVELDGGGDITWSVDSIIAPLSVPGTAGGNIPKSSTPINKPSRVRYMDGGQMLVVNTGANQVCKIDKGGWVSVDPVRQGTDSSYIRWMYDKFSDTKHLLRPGQPTELRSPTDALFWMEVEKPAGSSKSLLVYHCIIADSGNHRIVDLVYRFDNGLLVNADKDTTTGFYLPDLNWVTKTDTTSERYVYDCIQLVRTTDQNPSTGADETHDGIWAAVSNYRTSTALPGTPQKQGIGGAIVELMYRKVESNGETDYALPNSGDISACCDRVDRGGKTIPLANPRYFQVQDKYDPQGTRERYILICDNYGVYKVALTGGLLPEVLPDRILDDMTYRMAYRSLYAEKSGDLIPCPGTTTAIPGVPDGDIAALGTPLNAASVQELPDGSWLIANSYSGSDTGGYGSQPGINRNPFGGEVFIYTFPGPTNSNGQISWYAPSLIVPAATAPDGSTIYDPNVRRQRTSNGTALQQPKCAFRQF